MADYTPVKGFWQANASESAPSMATLSSQGYPTNGDPRKGTPATIPGAAWYYWVDQAIRAVIAASGKTSANPPSPTELRDALQSLGWLNEKSVKASMLDLDNIADSSLSATSTRPVQNKVVKSALDGKLSTSGGTVSGAVTFNGAITASFLKRSAGQKELIIGGTDDDGCLQLYAGDNVAFSSKKTASLFLTSTDYTGASIPAGEFCLSAMDATTGRKSLVGSPDGSLTWDGKPVLCGESGGFPVGFLSLYAGSNVPDGWFRCDGSTIADMATNYPKLYAVLGTNVLPNYSGRTLYGASSDINATIGSGLPNIQGKLLVTAGNEAGTYAAFPTRADGCFFTENWDESFITAYFVASGTAKTPTDTHKTATWFNAARSNSIYGASTTVQPPAVKVAVLIKHD